MIKHSIRQLALIASFLGYLWVFPAHAQQEILNFETPEQEAIYQELIKELRCLVCQNQNLADSNAGLAQDLRRKTHEMVVSGNDRDQVVDYMVERYGEFVLYRPLVTKSTFVLWFSPFILLGLLIALAFYFIKKSKRKSDPSKDYSHDDVNRVKSLIKEEN